MLVIVADCPRRVVQHLLSERAAGGLIELLAVS